MNLLLLEASEVDSHGHAVLTGRRLVHAREVLKVAQHDVLRVGVRGGRVGTGRVLETREDALVLQVELLESPPPRPDLDVVLAIPRPKALRRVIPALASMGVDRVILVNAARVEKSYFDSKVLAPEYLEELLVLGLEQARDTVAPTIELRERFKPFVEDELSTWPGQRLVFHPVNACGIPTATPGQRRVIAIGPDGGWVPFEVELLEKQGFVPVTLGPRILRVEVAVPAILGALTAY